MRTFEFFSRQGVVFLALMLVVGPIATFELDPRIGMLLVGGIFVLSGGGHFMVADKEISGRWLRKGLGIFLILFGVFTIVVMLVMFIRGEQLSTSSSHDRSGLPHSTKHCVRRWASLWL